MNIRKINVDRPRLTSEEINSKQQFDQLLQHVKPAVKPFWQSPWFWGPAGMACIGALVVMSLQSLNNQQETHEEKITLATTLPQDTKCVHPPIPGEDVPVSSYQVNPDKDQRIKLLSGTEVFIPKGSLDNDGKSGKVEINIREFTSQAAIFVAGVKMDYGKNHAFETAGMLEIKPSEKNESLKINPAVPIEVKMQLAKNPANFDFWYLDEKANAWGAYPATFTTEKVNGAIAVKENVAQLKISLQNTENKLKEVQTSLETLKEPGKSDFKIPVEGHQKFDLAFDKGAYPELASFDKLIFEVIPTSGYDKNFTKKTWSEMKLEKKGETYEAFFSQGKSEFRVPVRPVVSGKDLNQSQAAFDQAIQDYKTTKEDLLQKEQALVQQKESFNTALNEALAKVNNRSDAEFISSQRVEPVNKTSVSRQEVNDFQNVANFQVSRWGFYNCDKPINYPAPLRNEVAFLWKGGAVLQAVSIYVFNLVKKTRYSFGGGSMRDLTQFGFHKNDETLIVIIDKEGEIGQLKMEKPKEVLDSENLVFSRKEKETKTVEWLKKLMDENADS